MDRTHTTRNRQGDCSAKCEAIRIDQARFEARAPAAKHAYHRIHRLADMETDTRLGLGSHSGGHIGVGNCGGKDGSCAQLGHPLATHDVAGHGLHRRAHETCVDNARRRTAQAHLRRQATQDEPSRADIVRRRTVHGKCPTPCRLTAIHHAGRVATTAPLQHDTTARPRRGCADTSIPTNMKAER